MAALGVICCWRCWKVSVSLRELMDVILEQQPSTAHSWFIWLMNMLQTFHMLQEGWLCHWFSAVLSFFMHSDHSYLANSTTDSYWATCLFKSYCGNLWAWLCQILACEELGSFIGWFNPGHRPALPALKAHVYVWVCCVAEGWISTVPRSTCFRVCDSFGGRCSLGDQGRLHKGNHIWIWGWRMNRSLLEK